MTLRELINQVTDNDSESEVLDYNLRFLDMDDNTRSLNMVEGKIIIIDGTIEIELRSV